MAICVKNIDITAKSSVNSAIVSLRPNELICNLRALVAVRFEQAINIIVLVFGGQVLRDVGTIDSHGITSGVTVYVVFRQPITAANQTLVNDELDVDSGKGIGAGHVSLTKQQSHTFLPKNADMIRPLLDNPETLRDMLQADPHVKVLIDENASLRHFLSSDSNIRDLFLTILNPARIEELGRKRDIRIMRMERVPGSYQVLHRFSNHLRKAHEDNIALTYQIKDGPNMDMNYSADNPQRGRENRLPLPNPWRQPNHVELDDFFSRRAERMVNDMKQKFDHIMQLLQKGNLYMALQQSKALDEMADNAHRELTLCLRGEINCVTHSHVPPPPPPPVHIPVAATAAATSTNTSPLNLSDFLSCNNSRWEQKFRLELLELSSMGHTDRRRNICALLMSSGNVRMAVNLLEKWQR